MISLEPFFCSLRALHPVTASEEELLSDSLSTRTVEGGTVLHPAGRIARDIFFVCEGVLRLVKHTADGEDITICFLKRQKYATVMDSFLHQTPSAYSVEAACDAAVIVLPAQQLSALYKKINYLESLLIRILQQGLLEKVTTTNEYMGLDATDRYRHFLERESDIIRQVPLSAISSYLGMTQQSLSRIRRNIQL